MLSSVESKPFNPTSRKYDSERFAGQTDTLADALRVRRHATSSPVALEVTSLIERGFSFIRHLRAASWSRRLSEAATTANGIWRFAFETSRHSMVADRCSAISSSRDPARSHTCPWPFDCTTFQALPLHFVHENDENLLRFATIMRRFAGMGQLVAGTIFYRISLAVTQTGKRASQIGRRVS
jgi:hypothetical protein